MADAHTIAADAIVIKESLCTRLVPVNDYLVSRLVTAIRAGVPVEPVTIWKGTHVLVDGRQRVAAYARVHGPAAPVPYIERAFADEGSAFEAAMTRNARHGQALTPVDMTQCILRGAECGLEPARLMRALAVTEERYLQLSRSTATGEDGLLVPLKLAMGHYAGAAISDATAVVNRRSSGHFRIHVHQVLLHLRAGTVDWSDETTVRLVAELAAALQQVQTTTVAA